MCKVGRVCEIDIWSDEKLFNIEYVVDVVLQHGRGWASQAELVTRPEPRSKYSEVAGFSTSPWLLVAELFLLKYTDKGECLTPFIGLIINLG